MRAAAACAATAMLWLGGCAAGSSPTEPVEWDQELDLGVPGETVAVTEDVEFYPACGNETLNHDGTTWYPFTPANGEDFTVPSARATDGLGDLPTVGWSRASAVRALPAVVAPGPGDDTGTLVEFEGGFAHWVSDNGLLETWLTTTTISYSFLC
ncbi:hypothetical protein Dac01nite_07380 [Demequina activiva]|uniref:Uncharacterized protein n=2 Tax=Demequina activiva TaxID=1582364 RepID=A0A919Q146_9MICO|nr:hypothetical protein Dac01nite_07380 [Demequina activiva]